MASAREPAAPPDDQNDIEAGAFPTREYIGAMALEMARMAREEGDGRLAGLLEDAAGAAALPPG
ncbi:MULTISPECIES: hypothetical protein [unclassified Brevundimonas]|jgi:hypothetical protein|uniref:hypothetical protein n=1 Tax=unclassified Brevundimonas TaxID=2622653 RepID=UPI0025BDFD6D|nr:MULTISPECIES: hypothetical protein [unclassified Brevundimonas]